MLTRNRLAVAGRARGAHPKRFYKFALIDPTDQPFATFQYFYRTWEQLRYLGLIDGESDVDLSVIEPYEPGGTDTKREEEEDEIKLVEALGDVDLMRDRKNRAPTPYPQTYLPTGALHADALLSDASKGNQHSHSHNRVTTPSQLHRFSVPPALKLEPMQRVSRPLPLIPQKPDSSSQLTEYRPHPAYLAENGVSGNSSPVKSAQNMISTPPLPGRKKTTYAPWSLVNVAMNAWKRRGTPSGAFSSGGTNSRSSSRGAGG